MIHNDSEISNMYQSHTDSNSNPNSSLSHRNINNLDLHKLSVSILNVYGLKRRVLYPEFVEFGGKHDVFCVCETKRNNSDIIFCEGFTFFEQAEKTILY